MLKSSQKIQHNTMFQNFYVSVFSYIEIFLNVYEQTPS